MLVEVVHRGTALTVPPEVVTVDCGTSSAVFAELVELPFDDMAPEPFSGAASTKADGGSPPTVSASPAFSAYGTLSSRMRGCSSPPFTRTPSQRASPELNKSIGRPSTLVAPRCTAYLPPLPITTFCVSIHR